MIGEAENSDFTANRSRYDLLGVAAPVREGRVHVQIDPVTKPTAQSSWTLPFGSLEDGSVDLST